jgi:hypothetical protein
MTIGFRSAALELFLAVLIAGVMLAPFPASAGACIDPSGVEGEAVYNADYHTLQFCNGSVWVRMGGSNDPRIGTLTNG